MAAVNFASQPATIYNPKQSRYSMYNPHTQQPTPMSSATATPSTSSPTSPRTTSTSPANHHLHMVFTRQLHPPKAPLYTPAVLRPTEHPRRHSYTKSSSSNSIVNLAPTANTLTPPSSAEGSYESKEGESLVEESLQRRLLVNDGITRIVTDEWNDDVLENVTGQPTRDHWKPDSSSPTCDYPPCPSPFTLLRRRHHCRRCGNIFCSSHSLHEVPLDQHARFHPHGAMARACESCWGDYVAWKRRRDNREGSTSGASSSGSVVGTPIGEGRRVIEPSARKSGDTKAKETAIVGSVPRDWNWSTF